MAQQYILIRFPRVQWKKTRNQVLEVSEMKITLLELWNEMYKLIVIQCELSVIAARRAM
jgi:hypothetical protein